MTEVKTKKPPRILGLQPRDARNYLLTFTVIMGQSFSDSHKKFTRSETVMFSSNKTGLDFGLEVRNYLKDYAEEYFVFPKLKGLVKTLSLTFSFQELPC